MGPGTSCGGNGPRAVVMTVDVPEGRGPVSHFTGVNTPGQSNLGTSGPSHLSSSACSGPFRWLHHSDSIEEPYHLGLITRATPGPHGLLLGSDATEDPIHPGQNFRGDGHGPKVKSVGDVLGSGTSDNPLGSHYLS